MVLVLPRSQRGPACQYRAAIWDTPGCRTRASSSRRLTDNHGQILLLIVLSGIVGLWRSIVGPELPVSAINALRKRAAFGNKDGNFQPSRSDDEDVEDQVIDVLAVEDIEEQDGVGAGVDTYILYTGNGTVDEGWPDIDDWASFEDLCASFPYARSLNPPDNG